MPVKEKTNGAKGFAPLDAMGGLSGMVGEAAERGRYAMEAGLAAWSGEAQRFYEELASQGRTAIEQLKACQSPIDVLSVEQAWIAARSKAYMESGLRFAQAFAAVAQGCEAKANEGKTDQSKAEKPAPAPTAQA